jgi:hypothetical protein
MDGVQVVDFHDLGLAREVRADELWVQPGRGGFGEDPPRFPYQAPARLGQAAKDAGLRHVVWSTLEDTRPHFERLAIDVPTIMGTNKVPHFDAKAEANVFFTELGVPTTFLQTTFFYESFIVGGQGPHHTRTVSRS